MSRKEFELDMDEKQMKTLLKKAKRKHLIRNWIISICASILVVFGSLYVVFYLCQKNFNKMDLQAYDLQTVQGPNMQFYDRAKELIGLTGGTVRFNSYKNIAGQPVKWIDQVYEYSIWGFHEISHNGNIILDREAPNRGGNSTLPDYNVQTMQREMRFYLPFVTYLNYVDDLSDIGKFQNKVAEVALSFNKAYTIDQIVQMFPKEVQPVWYWVDTYNEKEPNKYKGLKDSKTGAFLNAEMSTNVYGFQVSYGLNEEDAKIDLTRQPQGFVGAMKRLSQDGQTVGNINESYKNIKGISPKDLPIYGVVVTGTTQSLQKLHGEPFIKAAVRGVTVEKQ